MDNHKHKYSLLTPTERSFTDSDRSEREPPSSPLASSGSKAEHFKSEREPPSSPVASSGSKAEPFKRQESATPFRRYSIQYPKWLNHSGLAESRVSRPLAIFFSFVGGYVEAVAYKKLFSIFVGPMSGNTVVLAYQTSEYTFDLAATRAATIATFVFGVFIFSIVREILNRYKVKRVAPVIFFLNLICLFIFFFLGTFVVTGDRLTSSGWGFYALMVPAVMACAVQTGALQRVSSLSVSSTIVTGTIAKATTELVSYLAARYDDYHGNLKDKTKTKFHRDSSLLYFGLWLTYFIGALAGSLAVRALDLYSLLPIIAILFILIVSDLGKRFCENVEKISGVNGEFEITDGAESRDRSAGLSGYQPPELVIPYEQ